jgi:O-antigen/teichoic acid export membrane protein
MTARQFGASPYGSTTRVRPQEPTIEPQPTIETQEYGEHIGSLATPVQRSGSTVLSGASVMLVSRVTVAILGWIGTILIARKLSVSDWGAFSFIFNLLGILGLLADLQVSRIVMVELMEADDDLEPVVGRYVALRLLLALASYILAFAVVEFGGYPHDVVVGTLIAGLSFFLAAVTWALVTVCQIKIHLRPVAIALALGQAVQLALTIALYATGTGSVVRYAIPAVLYDLVAMVFVVIAVRPIVHVWPRVDFARWWIWIKAAVPLALGSSLGTLYFRIDSVMLSQLDGLKAVGIYQYGYKFSDILGFVAASLLGVMLPVLIRMWPGNVPGFHRAFKHAFILLMIVGAAASVSFAVVAQRAMVSLFPNGGHAAAVPARVLVLGQALNFFTSLCAMTLIATERHRIYPVATFCGVVANVVLNLILIPHFSATGSGVATVLTELTVIAVMLTIVVRIDGVRPFPWRSMFIIGLACVAMAVTIGALQLYLWWPIALVAGFPVYLAVLHLGRVDGPGGLRRLIEESRGITHSHATA